MDDERGPGKFNLPESTDSKLSPDSSDGIEVRVKNFFRVSPWLYRGGQPDESALEQLKELGIRTVLSLRWGESLRLEEEDKVIRAGMCFESLPTNYIAPPGHRELCHLMTILADPERRPVYLHCLHGSDRTGILVAMYRIVNDGWTVESAYQEMKTLGFHKIRMRHYKWALFRFASDLP